MTWIATTRTPISTQKEVEDLKPPEGLSSLTKAERKQFDAAKKAAAPLVSAFKEANVNISGDVEAGVIQVHVGEANATH